uniref:TIR domain-containing protein n=1 Tax=Ciona savignyi TaxID=51511 RepID=H2Y9A8_CIOSA
MSSPLSLQDQADELLRINNKEEGLPPTNSEKEKSSLASKLLQDQAIDSLHGASGTTRPRVPTETGDDFVDAESYLHSPPSYAMQPSFDPMLGRGCTKGETSVNNVGSYAMGLPRSDFCGTLLRCLRFDTRRQLGLHLDPERSTVQNWQSLADLMGFSNLEIINFKEERYRTRQVLSEYEVRQPTATIGNLCLMLEQIGRQDVLTDMEPWFARDSTMAMSMPRGASSLSTSYHSWASSPPRNYPVQESLISSTKTEFQEYHEFPTSSAVPQKSTATADQEYARMVQMYNAVLLYDSADKDFVKDEFLPKIEKEAGLKLFVPERDLQGGDTAYQSLFDNMLKNCTKLVVILSNEFLRNKENQWRLNTGVSLDPASRGKKIIPVIYKKLTEPNVLGGINPCDRTRVLEDSWFWNNIIRSLGGIPPKD